MPIGSPNPTVTRSQPYTVFGDFTVSAGGDILGRARTGTGGGSVYCRHVYAGGSIGGFHLQDSVNFSGQNIFTIMANAQPATAIKCYVNNDGVEVWSADYTTGALTVDSLIAAIDGGVTFGDGRPNSGVVLGTNSEARSVCNEDFTPIGWRLVTDSNGGSFRVQVLRQSYSSYDNSTWVDVTGTSTGSHGMPRTTIGNYKNTDSNITGWASTSDWSRGDVIRAIVNTNTASAAWYSLQIYGYRNVKKT